MNFVSEIWPIDRLVEYARNPRKNDHAVDAVASAIREYGFRPIPGFDGYEASYCGQIRSIKANKVMKQKTQSNGYMSVGLSVGGRYHYRGVHRLVAMAWLGVPDDAAALHVAHSDGDKTNNHVQNLRWATPLENNMDKIGHGTLKGARHGEAHHQSRLKKCQVRRMRDAVRSGVPFMDVVAQEGIPKNTAYDAVVGKTWSSVNALSEPVALKAVKS